MARIPLDHPRTLLVRAMEFYSRRTYGKMLEPGLFALHSPKVMWTMLSTELSAARWKSLPTELSSLAVMASAATIGCSWCMDFGYWESYTAGLSAQKLEAVPQWRDSDLFDDHERQILGYAEAMSATPPEVTDEMVEDLRGWLTDKQLVELTSLIALENQRSRTYLAAGLTSQGFKEFCELRPATTTTGSAA